MRNIEQSALLKIIKALKERVPPTEEVNEEMVSRIEKRIFQAKSPLIKVQMARYLLSSTNVTKHR